jgi:uncharacterized short protein YbdD (DUF466 family)
MGEYYKSNIIQALAKVLAGNYEDFENVVEQANTKNYYTTIETIRSFQNSCLDF